eukprot:gene8498-322_t
MKNLPNEVLVEILFYSSTYDIYSNIQFISSKFYKICQHQVFYSKIPSEHKIPIQFISKYMNKIETPEDLFIIMTLWKERNPIYLYEAITSNKKFNFNTSVTWRVDLINLKELKSIPEFNISYIPISSTKALNVKLYLKEEDLKELKIKIELNSTNNPFPFHHFFEVEGNIKNTKIIDGIVYVDLFVSKIDLVINLENKIKHLPKYQPFQNLKFEHFFTRYKGKIIEWNSYIESIEENKINLDNPQVTLYLNNDHNLIEGDFINYKARIGNFLSLYSIEYQIIKPVSIFDSIKNEIILSTLGTSFIYLLYFIRKRNVYGPFLSEFSSILGVFGVIYFNVLSPSPIWLKLLIDSITLSGIYKYWGNFHKFGLSILLFLLSGGFVAFNLFELFDKLKKIIKRKGESNK